MNRLLLAGCLILVCISYSYADSTELENLSLQDRKGLLENVKNLLYGEKPTKGGYFGDGLYADNQRAVFTHLVPNVNDMRNPVSMFVYRYDFKSKTHEQMIPYEFLQVVPHTYKPTLDISKQWGVFKRGGGSVLIEMDYVRGTWNELGFYPIEERPRDVQWVSEPKRFAFTYPQNGFDRGLPDLFGLDVVDVKTGERKNILSRIKCQVHTLSSWGSKLDYLFLNENTLLYSETIEPYRVKDDEGNPLEGLAILQQFTEDPKPHNALWRMNVASGAKIQLATQTLKVLGELVLRDGTVVWNRVEIGSATDILQRK